jgi:uncharacterized membrane protein (UPF0182 family)
MSRRRVAGLLVVAVLVTLFGGRWVALRYTEHAWYSDLGLARQFWVLLLRAAGWQLGVVLAATGWYAAHTLAVYRSIGSIHLPRRVGNLEIAEQVPRHLLRLIALGIALLLGVATAYSFSDVDHLVALYRHAVPLGFTEPVLQRDASFYLARLPLLETLNMLAAISVLLASALTVGLYALTGNLSVAQRRLRITPHARTHVILLMTVTALVVAWAFHLDAYQLVGGGGSAQGALSAVDRAIRIPASTSLAIIALIVAAGTVSALRWMRPGVLIGLWATLVAASLLGRFVVPFLAEGWDAPGGPGVAQALASYADGYSRVGFGLLEVRGKALPATPELAPESAGRLAAELEGVSPWSGEPGILEALVSASAPADTARVQAWTVSVGRLAGASGAEWLAALAVPQTDPLRAARLTPRPRWAALHRGALAWGGEPIALNAGGGGFRNLASLDPLDTASGAVPVARAPGRIRFLPRAAELGVVGPDEGTVLEPPPGLLLGTFVRRLLFAWALQAAPLLDDHTSAADRLIFWRDVPSRLARLYPFAAFDAPRVALVGGRLVWIVDGYLASSRFPLGEYVRWHGDNVNYLTAPYVVTVDAVTGSTRLYLRGTGLAFAAEVARGEGTEALPSDSMSADLRRRLDYPLGLFGAQAAMLARRGDDNARGERRWALAARDSGVASAGDAAQLRPAVALLALGEAERRLWYLLPLTDAAGNRLTAIVAATGGEDGSFRLELLRLPEGFPTPSAAASRLSSAPAVLAASAAASGPEGAVRRGPVFPVPAAGTIAYQQVIYGSTHRTAEPLSVRAVALAVGGRVGVGSDAASAVRALERGETGGGDFGAEISLAVARAAFLALDSAVRRADWAEFARAYAVLRRALGVGVGERP